MPVLQWFKVVAALPAQLVPDGVYAVRVGAGFDLYMADATGSVAHKVNGTAVVASATRAPWGALTRSGHSGHSLTDAYVKNGGSFVRIRDSLFDPNDEFIGVYVAEGTIPGSPLSWRWVNPSSPFDPVSEASLVDALMITEGGPPPHASANPSGLVASLDYVMRFAANQIATGGGNEVLLWSIWPDLRGPGRQDGQATPAEWEPYTFRTGLAEYEKSFAFWADYASWKLPQLYGLPAGWRVWLIPGHAWMARVYDDVAQGLVPGIAAFADLFTDTIHPTEACSYGLASLVFSATYQIDLRTRTGVYVHAGVSTALRDYFWTVAWEVATGYERVGLGGTGGVSSRWDPDIDADPLPAWTLANPVIGGGSGSNAARVAHGAGDWFNVGGQVSYGLASVTTLAFEWRGRVTALDTYQQALGGNASLIVRSDGRIQLYAAGGGALSSNPVVVPGETHTWRLEIDTSGASGWLARGLMDGVPIPGCSLAGTSGALDLSYLGVLRHPDIAGDQVVGETEWVRLWVNGAQVFNPAASAAAWNAHAAAAPGATFTDVAGSGGGGATPPGDLPAASETVAGIVELATLAEAVARTDGVRAVTPAGLGASLDAVLPGLATDAELAAVAAALPGPASATAAGIARFATATEARALTRADLMISAATLAAALADLPAPTPLAAPFVAPTSGRWISTGHGPLGGPNSGNSTADRLDLYQFRPARLIGADALGFQVGTAVAGAVGKVVLYSADATTGRPAGLLFESAALDCSTTGSKVAALGATLSLLLGVTYWLGTRFSAAGVNCPWLPVVNLPDIHAAAPPGNSGINKVVRRTVVTSGAAPATWAWSDAEATATAPSAIHLGLRAA